MWRGDVLGNSRSDGNLRAKADDVLFKWIQHRHPSHFRDFLTLVKRRYALNGQSWHGVVLLQNTSSWVYHPRAPTATCYLTYEDSSPSSQGAFYSVAYLYDCLLPAD